MRRMAIVACVLGIGLAAGRVGAQPEKFSLSMFHFNVQYVAGGLQGFPSGSDDRDVFDLDDAQVQDLIIVESFEPILDLFLAHPGWHVTLEMQAYMAEVMLERHPGVLAKLRQLVDAGQAELVSFHWSDELFLAYPRRDLEVSHALMADVWARTGLTPSGTVFCQEGQFGEGMAAFGAEHDRNILVLPKNLFRYQHLTESDTAAPLYDLDGVDVVIGARSFATAEVEVGWNFFDDGELLATGGHAPYVGKDFAADPAAVAEYEANLEALEADGVRIATIGEYVQWAKAHAIAQPELPPMLDGTWQPPSTDSMFRWMGASGLIDQAFGGERDNAVLTGNVRARHHILAAETLAAYAAAQGWIEADQAAVELEPCWRSVLLAQVSDASGINPFVGEVRYGLDNAAAALACADEWIARWAPEVGGPFVWIDPGNGQVGAADDQPSDLSVPADPFFSAEDGFSVQASGREVALDWQHIGQGYPLRFVTRLTIAIGPAEAGQRSAEVVFPLMMSGFYSTPGLVEDRVDRHYFSEFDLQDGRIALPLANGLIGLGEDVWLIKQTDSVHLAAILEPGAATVRFEDQTLDPDGAAEWVFWLVEGTSDEALALAERLNVRPVLWIETGVASGRGCGCGGGPGGLWLGLLLAAWALHRCRRAGQLLSRWKKPLRFLATFTPVISAYSRSSRS